MTQEGGPNIVDGLPPEPVDLDVNNGPARDPLECLIGQLPACASQRLIQAWFTAATEECRPFVGTETHWNNVSDLISLLNAWNARLHRLEISFSTDPTSLGCLKALDLLERKCLRISMRLVKILASPGLTLSEMLRQELNDNPQLLLADDFDRKFLGQGAYYLHHHILEKARNLDSAIHYNPIVPIIQSSGSGKSKTAVSLGNLELGLYTSVRPWPVELDIKTQSRPVDVVADWLCHSVRSPLRDLWQDPPLDPFQDVTDDAVKRNRSPDRVAIWLKCFADVFKRRCCGIWIMLYGEELVPGLDISDEGTRIKWQRFKERMAQDMYPSQSIPFQVNKRERLLSAIHNQALSCLVEYERDYKETARAPNDKEDTGVRGLSSTDKPPTKWDRLRDKAVNDARESWSSLEAILPVNSTAFIHLTIDESWNMGALNLVTLRKNLDHMKLKRSFILLVGTNTQISRLTGPQGTASPRLVNKISSISCRPFTSLPVDLGMISRRPDLKRVCTGEDCNQSHQDLRELHRYMGRPLWDGEWLQVCRRGGPCVAGIDLAVVLKKLLGRSFRLYKIETIKQVVALVSQRFPLPMPESPG